MSVDGEYLDLFEVIGVYMDIQPPVSFHCTFQFTIVLMTMLVSTIPVSILGAHFAMDVDPFRSPEQYC